ncbi:MAG: hypothetical protein WA064_01965 [Candidatus Moraniibacteriota bacterium]
MAIKILSPEAAMRMMELAENQYRPTQIVALKAEIEGETRAAELSASVTGTIDYARVQKIVALKLKLDHLYGAWAEGKIE